MATSREFAEYVCGQLRTGAAVRAKKMFGEYSIYLNERPALLLCDNTVYVKKLPELAGLLAGGDTGYPYEGAKEHYVLDPDDATTFARVIALLEDL